MLIRPLKCCSIASKKGRFQYDKGQFRDLSFVALYEFQVGVFLVGPMVNFQTKIVNKPPESSKVIPKKPSYKALLSNRFSKICCKYKLFSPNSLFFLESYMCLF